MSASEILNIVALIIVPIVAVHVGQYLQDRAEARKDKMRVFRTLMTARIYGWTRESVDASNIIDVVFADDKRFEPHGRTFMTSCAYPTQMSSTYRRLHKHDTNCLKRWRRCLATRAR